MVFLFVSAPGEETRRGRANEGRGGGGARWRVGKTSGGGVGSLKSLRAWQLGDSAWPQRPARI